MAKRRKFATQVASDLLAQIKAIAESEGREIQSVVEEALADLVEKKRRSKPRAHVMAHYEASVAQFDHLYKRLAE